MLEQVLALTLFVLTCLENYLFRFYFIKKVRNVRILYIIKFWCCFLQTILKFPFENDTFIRFVTVSTGLTLWLTRRNMSKNDRLLVRVNRAEPQRGGRSCVSWWWLQRAPRQSRRLMCDVTVPWCGAIFPVTSHVHSTSKWLRLYESEMDHKVLY